MRKEEVRMDEAQKRSWLEIDLARLEENYHALRALLPKGCRFLGVVKADAYGHGAIPVAKKLQALGAEYLAVACLDEAEELRSAGITLPVLILGYTPVECAERLMEGNITQLVYDAGMAEEFSRRAQAMGGTLKCHVAMDTGMSRLGFSCHEEDLAATADTIAALKALPGLELEGICTHFANADGDETYSRLQIDRFTAALNALKERGITFAIRHCTASAALLNYGEAAFDMVRPGILLYGHHPDKSTEGLVEVKPVMQWKARVASVKKLPKGTCVSYGCTYTLQRDSVLAVIAAGYADGVYRRLSNQMEVLLHGKRVKQLGRVCMDMFMVDVTDLPGVQPGDVATLFGEDGGEYLPIEQLSDTCGTIPYEIMCAPAPRVKRVYRD